MFNIFCVLYQDQVIFSNLGSTNDQSYFYLNPETGRITLRKLLTGISQNQFTVRN